jgi:ABC-2 type transport system permease protein
MLNQINLIAFRTIVNKEINRFMRIWSQTLLPSAITQTLYFVIFGGIIGSQIRNIPLINEFGQVVKTVPYMQFVVPGLVMMAVLTNAFANTVSSFFGSKFQKNIEELLVSPTSNWVIVWGYTIGGAIRGVLVGIIIFAVAFLFNAVPEVSNYWIISLFVTLTAIVFSLAGLTNGIFAKKFDDVSIFPTFVLTPLTYLGGVFYSIKSLPITQFSIANIPLSINWQEISKLNPIVYMVDGFRYGFFGTGEMNIYFSLGMLIVFIATLSSLNLYFLNKGNGMRS